MTTAQKLQPRFKLEDITDQEISQRIVDRTRLCFKREKTASVIAKTPHLYEGKYLNHGSHKSVYQLGQFKDSLRNRGYLCIKGNVHQLWIEGGIDLDEDRILESLERYYVDKNGTEILSSEGFHVPQLRELKFALESFKLFPNVPDDLSIQPRFNASTSRGRHICFEHTFTIVEDLSEEGKLHVVDALNFDYTSLENGEELRSLFENESTRLIALGEKYHVDFGSRGHSGPKIDPVYELKKAFHLQIDPQKRLGVLWLGDLDHFCLSDPKTLKAGTWKLSERITRGYL